MLSDDKKFKILKAAGPIGFGRLQTIATFLKEAKRLKISIDDILKYVEEEQVRRKSTIETARNRQKKISELYRKKAPRCPDCGSILRLAQIPYENKNKYKSRWFCVTGYDSDDPNGICGFEILNKEDMDTIYINLGIKEKKDGA